MDGGGVVGDRSLEVVIDLEVIGHVAVLLPVRLIKLHREERERGERDGGVGWGGGVVKYREMLVNCGCDV